MEKKSQEMFVGNVVKQKFKFQSNVLWPTINKQKFGYYLPKIVLTFLTAFGRLLMLCFFFFLLCFVIWGFNLSNDPSFQISNYNLVPAPLLASTDPCPKYFQVRHIFSCFNAEKQMNIKTWTNRDDGWLYWC